MTARPPSDYRGDDKLLFGIILGVLAFWLFAQTTLNIAPAMAADLNVATSVMNIAVSITALFSGIFIVVIGGLADRLGREDPHVGLCIEHRWLAPRRRGPTRRARDAAPDAGRICQGLSGAFIMPASLALIKTYWDESTPQIRWTVAVAWPNDLTAQGVGAEGVQSAPTSTNYQHPALAAGAIEGQSRSD